MGLNSLDEPQSSWEVRRAFGVSLVAVEGGGWVGSCMLRFPQNFDFARTSAIVCTVVESQSCDSSCPLMILVFTEHLHFVHDHNGNITSEVLVLITYWKLCRGRLLSNTREKVVHVFGLHFLFFGCFAAFGGDFQGSGPQTLARKHSFHLTVPRSAGL